MSEYLKQKKNALTQPKAKNNDSGQDRAAQLKELQYYMNQKPKQRFAKEEGEEKQLKSSTTEEETLQSKNDPSNTSSSSQMPEDVKSKMENSFGTDFSDVNIHKNSDQATNIGALAYTQGSDIHFAPGQYKPDSQKGQELLGHELTHVVQQIEGRVKPDTEQHKGLNINSDTSLEKEADEAGAKAAQGKMADVRGSGNEVQRKVDDKETQLTINDKKPYDLSKKVPFPSNVNKEELLAKAEHNLTAINRAHALLIRNCILAIDKVQDLSNMKDDDVFQLFLQKIVGASIDKIRSLNKYLEVAGTIIKAGIESSKASGAVDGAKKSALTFTEIRSQLQFYDINTTAEIQDIDNNLENNYDLTDYIASFTVDRNDILGIEVATSQFEIEVWKKVLPLKWKHMIAGEPSFHSNIDWLSKNEAMHINCYYTYKSGEKWGLFYDTKGFYVKEHWLGSGRHPFMHDKAPKELADHLFNKLGISRKDLFENWNIPIQTFNTGGNTYGFGRI
jgi:hypothetical protein